jgi:4-carboxymuconolactone decarboxylase
MRLEQRDKELAAIGASIGANCRPCAEHHVPAGREAGLTERELADAVAAAQTIRHQAIDLFAARVDELLGHERSAPEPELPSATSRERELVALGASIGANSHPLIDLHVGAARDVGLTATEVEAALKMAEYVQQRAAEMTAEAATRAVEELVGAVTSDAGS